MLKAIRRFIHNESGATAIEYALIAALIAVAIVGAVQGVGTHVSTVFSQINNAL